MNICISFNNITEINRLNYGLKKRQFWGGSSGSFRQQKKEAEKGVKRGGKHFGRITWSNSRAPGYRGQPKKSSAITHPSDHMSMASQKGRPRMISGALKNQTNTTANMKN